MKLLTRILHEIDSFSSWLLDGEPYIDGHLWQDKRVWKDGDKYRVESECVECGKKENNTWMDEMMYFRTKDQYPPLDER